jgi:hypothetical protein
MDCAIKSYKLLKFQKSKKFKGFLKIENTVFSKKFFAKNIA